MARPNKNNALYFTHDADMRNDVKIKALRHNFKHKGYAVWNFLLEVFTDGEDFEVEFDEVNIELLAADFDVTPQELTDIVNYCCKIGLLQKENTRLFSLAHKRRFSELLEQREKRSEAGRKGMASRWGNRDNKTAETGNDTITELSQSVTEDNKIEDNRLEKNRIKEIAIIYPYQDIADKWNSICGAFLPKVLKLSESRKTKIRARLTEFGKQEVWIPTIEALFKAVIDSNFLRGDNSNGWVATFDWLFDSPKNWVKVMEGNYDNHRGGKQAAQQANAQLGVGEFIDNTGRRTYGTGRATIPNDAPPRPSERHAWNSSTSQWIIL